MQSTTLCYGQPAAFGVEKRSEKRDMIQRVKSKYKPGDYVKVEFPDEASGVAEWMWVRIRRCDDEKQIVFGTLDNAPINDPTGELKLGTELAISFSQIREHKAASE